MEARIFKIGNIFVSTALLTERFTCDIAVCKGKCCVEGDSGAPLKIEEVDIISREYESFAPYMTQSGRDAVQQQGVAIIDFDGEWVTPLIEGAECAYARFDQVGICSCAIEYAFHQGVTSFRKPISCWLYPIRVHQLSLGIALNYHNWHLCAGACLRGKREDVPVYRFLKEAIIAKFGDTFYKELDAVAMH